MRQILLILAALLAGFVGGILGTSVVRTREDARPRSLVRARAFELTNDSGQVVSYWGVDAGENAVLAFGRPVSRHPPLGLRNPHNQLAAIGLLLDGSPYLTLTGADGETRVRLYLTQYEKPTLLLEDESGPRVALGIVKGDTDAPIDSDVGWALDFLPHRASIGVSTEWEGKETYVRGFLDVNRDKVKYPYRQAK